MLAGDPLDDRVLLGHQGVEQRRVLGGVGQQLGRTQPVAAGRTLGAAQQIAGDPVSRRLPVSDIRATWKAWSASA